jgi:hypothetical protein
MKGRLPVGLALVSPANRESSLASLSSFGDDDMNYSMSRSKELVNHDITKL